MAGLLSLIAAVADNGVIGRDGDLPWRLPADLKRFKAVTLGHPLIMGRRTWESLGRPLPGRRSIVLSRRGEPVETPGVETVPDLDAALERAAQGEGREEIFVIGGAEVYRQALPHAHRLYLTRVHAEVEGDTYFPPFEADDWRLVEQEAHGVDARHAHPFTFELYERS